jgi:hypothetical protein
VKPWERAAERASEKDDKKPWEKAAESVVEGENTTMDDVIAGTTELVEGATGYGTELGAVGQQLGSTVYDIFNTDKGVIEAFQGNFGEGDFDRAFEDVKRKQDIFERDHEGLSDSLAVGGMVAGLAIPGATLMKGGKLAKTAAVAAEGAVYGAGTDEGDRATGAAVGAAVGTAAGALLPKAIEKWQTVRAKPEATADEVAEAGQDMLEAKAGELGGWSDVSKGEYNQAWSEYATGVSDAVSRRVSPEVGGRMQRADETAMRFQTKDTEEYLENAGMKSVIELAETDEKFKGIVLDYARHSGSQDAMIKYVRENLDDEAASSLMKYMRWSDNNNRAWNMRAGNNADPTGYMHTQTHKDSVLTGSQKPADKNKINELDDDLNRTNKDTAEMDRTRGLASKGEVRVDEYQNPFLTNANRIFNNNRILQLAEKFGVKDVSGGPEAVMDAIEEAIKKRGINDEAARDARNAMATLLKGQNRSSNAWAKAFVNSGYTVLAGPKTVMLNFHDWPVALWNQGVRNASALWNDVSKGGADAERLGITGQNVGEFVQAMRRNSLDDTWKNGGKAERVTDAITQKAMKFGGFAWADMKGKNGVLRVVASEATNLAKEGKLGERWGTFFDPKEISQIEAAINKSGGDWNKMSRKDQELYDEMLTLGLGQQQLISSAGRPEQWLNDTRLRPLYMMRGFAIKHNALLNERVFKEFKAGNMGEAAKNASLYMILPGASYAGMNVARNEIFKEDYEATGEEFMYSLVDSVAGPMTLNMVGGGSSYERKELAQDPVGAVMESLLPPGGLVADAGKAMSKAINDGDAEALSEVITKHPMYKQWAEFLD